MKQEINCDLGLLAKVLGKSLGVEVIENANTTTFSVNENHQITVPAVFAGEDEAIIMRGGLAHEATGHVRHTDFEALGKWADKKSALGMSLQNIIEDIRIERAAAQVFPGVRRILSEMAGALEKRGFFKVPENQKPASVICAFLIRALREQELGQPIDSAEAQALAEFTFTAPLCSEILEEARKGSRGSSTADVLASADRILEILNQAQTPEEPEPEPEPEPKQGGQENTDEGQEGGSGANQGSDGGDTANGGQASGQESPPDEGTQGAPGAPGKEKNRGPKESAKVAKAAKAALDASADDIGETDVGKMAAKAIEDVVGGGLCPPVDGLSVRFKNKPVGESFTPDSSASSLSMRLRCRLQEHLQAHAEDEDFSLADRGRLVPRMAARARVGDRNIFEVEGDEAEGLDTAVWIMVDASGSMAGWEEKSALSAIYAMSSAMAQYERQGVVFALSAFKSYVQDIKGFDDPWVSRRHNLNDYRAGGGTQFTGAIRSILPDLMARGERRKVLFAITDGDVGRSDQNRAVMATAKRHGVEVRVLYIAKSQQKSWQAHGFTDADTAMNEGELQKAILGTLKSCM